MDHESIPSPTTLNQNITLSCLRYVVFNNREQKSENETVTDETVWKLIND